MRRKLILIALLITVLISFVVGVRTAAKGSSFRVLLRSIYDSRRTTKRKRPRDISQYLPVHPLLLTTGDRLHQGTGFQHGTRNQTGIGRSPLLEGFSSRGRDGGLRPIEGTHRWKTLYSLLEQKNGGFIEQPVDNHQRPLIPRESCAVSQPYALVKSEALLRIDSLEAIS
jgi:hypothetical protein